MIANWMKGLAFGYSICSFLAPFIDVSFPGLALVSLALANSFQDYLKYLSLHFSKY